MRSLDLADLVVIAGRALGLDSDAVLDLLDLEAADAALAAARLDAETGAAQGPGRAAHPAEHAAAAHPAEHAAAVLLVELVRRRPLARGNGAVALLAVAQLLALNGLRIDLDPEGATDLLTEVAAGRMGAGEVRGWIVARLCPPEAAHGKQARLGRAARKLRRERELRPPDPFARFTPPARNAVALAHAEARELGHGRIGTEHLLLGLLAQPEELAARALASLGVTAEAVRAETERIVGRGHGLPEGPVPFAPRVKKVLEMSTRESLRRGQAAVRSEHLLLALLAEGNGMAAKILVTLVGSLQRVELALADREADEVAQLRAEVARLRALLDRHGIPIPPPPPQDGTATAS